MFSEFLFPKMGPFMK